jgi:hypothetical protein
MRWQFKALTVGNAAFCIYGFRIILSVNGIIFSNSVVTVKCGVLFEVRTEFLNII